MNYPDQTIIFKLHTDASDKHLSDVVSQDNKYNGFLLRILSKAQCTYTTTEEELLSIIDFLKQFWGILFFYEINVLSDHKNMVCVDIPSISKGNVLDNCPGVIFANTHNIATVGSIKSDTIIRISNAR